MRKAELNKDNDFFFVGNIINIDTTGFIEPRQCCSEMSITYLLDSLTSTPSISEVIIDV